MAVGAGGRAAAPHIAVQVDALETFALAIEATIDHHQASLDHIANTFASGTPFGVSSPSDDVRGASNAYGAATYGMTTQFTQLTSGMTALVHAIRTIAVRYRTVDELRGADMADVSTIVSDAVTRELVPAAANAGASRTQVR